MPIRKVDLTKRHARFISDQVQSGRYRDESEVMQAGIRLLEKLTEREMQKLKALRLIAKEGFDQLDQGMGVVLHGNDELRHFIKQIGKRTTSTVKRKVK